MYMKITMYMTHIIHYKDGVQRPLKAHFHNDFHLNQYLQ